MVDPLGQIVAEGAAFTFIVGKPFTTNETVEVEFAHGELETVHKKTYVPGMVKPVTVVAALAGVVIVAMTGPLCCVHTPVPVVGEVALRFPVVLIQTGVADPAFATEGGGFTVNCI